jgi:hypothetical protein
LSFFEEFTICSVVLVVSIAAMLHDGKGRLLARCEGVFTLAE